MKKFVAIFALGLASMLFAEAPAVYKKCVSCHGLDGKKVGVAPKAIAGLSKQQALDSFEWIQKQDNQVQKSKYNVRPS